MSSQSDALKIDIAVNNMTNANSSYTSYVIFNIFKMAIFFTEILFIWENGTLEKYYIKVNRPDLN